MLTSVNDGKKHWTDKGSFLHLHNLVRKPWAFHAEGLLFFAMHQPFVHWSRMHTLSLMEYSLTLKSVEVDKYLLNSCSNMPCSFGVEMVHTKDQNTVLSL